MKKYTRPEFYRTKFVPNEYIAACDNPHMTVSCTVTSGEVIIYPQPGQSFADVDAGGMGAYTSEGQGGTLFRDGDTYVYFGTVIAGHSWESTTSGNHVVGEVGPSTGNPCDAHDHLFPSAGQHHHMTKLAMNPS